MFRVTIIDNIEDKNIDFDVFPSEEEAIIAARMFLKETGIRDVRIRFDYTGEAVYILITKED